MKRDTKIAAVVFAAIPLVILGFAVGATWLLAHGASPSWRLPFRAICHGIASRCLQLWQVPMPLCARCTALYAGMLAGLAGFAFVRVEEWTLRLMLYTAVVPLAIDGVSQALRLRESTNDIRVVTGLLAGFAFGMWILSYIERREPRQFTSS